MRTQIQMHGILSSTITKKMLELVLIQKIAGSVCVAFGIYKFISLALRCLDACPSESLAAKVAKRLAKEQRLEND